mgnify:CR=1 FL=1
MRPVFVENASRRSGMLRLVATGATPGAEVRMANAKSIGWAIYAAGFVIWLLAT